MVTVDLFRLSRHDHMVGHVRILRESSDQFHAIISYRDSTEPANGHDRDDTTSHRLLATSRKQAIAAALGWADSKFGGNCLLLPLRNNLRRGGTAQIFAH